MEDYICCDKFMEEFPSNYFNTYVVKFNSNFHFRNKVIYPPLKNMNFIITGHSDYPITNHEVSYFSPKKWFAINNETTSENVISIPLGLKNFDYIYFPENKIMGNVDLFKEVLSENFQGYKNLVYMNFSVHTYPNERGKVFNMFRFKDWVSKEDYELSIEGMKRYLRNVRTHKFVLCPRGNGIDTHRLWETLYMGSIPIVVRDKALNNFTDLPICWINNWEEVNPEFLEREFIHIKSTVWNLDKLKFSYWKNMINNYI